VGLLLFGVILGPHVLDLFGQNRPIANFFADLGKLLLMFSAGLETDTVVSRRHFFSVAPDWRHVTGTMMAASGDLRGFVSERH